jgi:hypothetical protein
MDLMDSELPRRSGIISHILVNDNRLAKAARFSPSQAAVRCHRESRRRPLRHRAIWGRVDYSTRSATAACAQSTRDAGLSAAAEIFSDEFPPALKSCTSDRVRNRRGSGPARLARPVQPHAFKRAVDTDNDAARDWSTMPPT